MNSALLPHIEVDRLTKRFANSVLFDQLALTVYRGEKLILLGESGSGKSTLLRILAGLDPAIEARIRVQGLDQQNIAPHMRDMAIVFQTGNGYEHLTVDDNLKLALRRNTLVNATAKKECLQDCLERFELQSLTKLRMRDLSGGQSQRVAIARAFLSGKNILLLDEPLVHLDQIRRMELRSMIGELQQKFGNTMLYVTHDLDEAKQLGDRIAILEAGRISQIGSVDEVFKHPKTRLAAALLCRTKTMS